MKWFNATHIAMELKQIELNRKSREQEFVDDIAVKVLVALIEQSRNWPKEQTPEALAAWSYETAREMLKAREVKEEQVSEPKPRMRFNGYQPTGPACKPGKPPRKP